MPKKKYNDQELKKKALELRKQGLSYRKIAKELNCSVFKVHRILTNTIAARNEKEKYYTYESIDTTEENSEFILPTL